MRSHTATSRKNTFGNCHTGQVFRRSFDTNHYHTLAGSMPFGSIIGKEAASWLCLLVAAPVAIAGFFHYNGMTLEQFLWAFIKSEILCAGPRRFDSVNLHEEVFADIMGGTLE